MELRQLETLLAVDEEGTFTAAADTLHTVQSNVSEQVRQLEAELGVSCSSAAGGGDADRVGPGRARPRPPHPARARAAARGRRHAAGPPGRATRRFGVVGTVSRWLVPALVAELAQAARPASRCASTKARRSGCSPRC